MKLIDETLARKEPLDYSQITEIIVRRLGWDHIGGIGGFDKNIRIELDPVEDSREQLVEKLDAVKKELGNSIDGWVIEVETLEHAIERREERIKEYQTEIDQLRKANSVKENKET